MSEQPEPAAGIESLLERARKGDRGAENLLFEKLHARILTLAKKRVWDEEGARDLAQDTLKTVFEKYQGADVQHGFLPWVFTILHNKVGNYLKRRRVQAEHAPTGVLPDVWNTVGVGADGEAGAIDLLESIEKAARRASPDCRTVLRLLLEEAARGDIIKAFDGDTAAAVDSRISRCRDRLLRELERLWSQGMG